ncbi:protein of unknown function [Agreia sp. COWG]|nr:protein of unknown function [Agreia sp. COWG]
MVVENYTAVTLHLVALDKTDPYM